MCNKLITALSYFNSLQSDDIKCHKLVVTCQMYCSKTSDMVYNNAH